MLVTALAPHIGYDNSAKIAKAALKNNTTLKQEALKSGLINEKDYNKILNILYTSNLRISFHNLLVEKRKSFSSTTYIPLPFD